MLLVGYFYSAAAAAAETYVNSESDFGGKIYNFLWQLILIIPTGRVT